jgi:hypothetical protein
VEEWVYWIRRHLEISAQLKNQGSNPLVSIVS